MDYSKCNFGKIGVQTKTMRDVMQNVIKYKKEWMMSCGITDWEQLKMDETFKVLKLFLTDMGVKAKNIKYSASGTEQAPGIIYMFT